MKSQRKVLPQQETTGRTSLVVQWITLCVSTARCMILIPGWGSKIPHTSQVQQKKKKKKQRSKPEADILAMDAEGKFCLPAKKTNKDLSQRKKIIVLLATKSQKEKLRK